MSENITPVSSPDPAGRLVASAVLTAAAIQTGKVDAGDKAAVAEYFNALHLQLFGTRAEQ